MLTDYHNFGVSALLLLEISELAAKILYKHLHAFLKYSLYSNKILYFWIMAIEYVCNQTAYKLFTDIKKPMSWERILWNVIKFGISTKILYVGGEVKLSL
jgi:hypothetical protein